MALMAQLSPRESNIPRAVRQLYYNYAGGPPLPSVRILKETLFSILPVQTDCYVVLDAIDECSNLQETLDFVTSLQKRAIEGSQFLHIMVTSRRLYEIEATFRDVRPYIYMIPTNNDTGEDMKIFILHRLNERDHFQKFSMELKALVLDVLSEKSQGMFVFYDLLKASNTNISHH